MKTVGLPKLYPVGLVLVSLTLVSVWIGHASGHSRIAVVGLFTIAAIKAEMVLDHFMEAPRAERHWRWLYRLWIAVVALMLAAAFAG